MYRFFHSVLLLLLLLLLLAAPPVPLRAEEAAGSAGPHPVACAGEDAVSPQGELLTDWQCLRQAYPQLHCLRADAAGRLWLELADGRRVLYDGGQPFAVGQWDVDVRASMAQPYPLDPLRPSTPPGVSPGRWRSYELLRTLYGGSAAAIRPRLRTGMFFGQAVRMEARALAALQRVEARLAPVVASQPHLRAYLKSAGGFNWRGIAGENGRLAQTLFGLVECGCNLHLLSKKLGQHENTLRQRLGRIASLTGLDFRKVDQYEQLSLAVKIHNCIEGRGKLPLN